MLYTAEHDEVIAIFKKRGAPGPNHPTPMYTRLLRVFHRYGTGTVFLQGDLLILLILSQITHFTIHSQIVL